MPQNERIRGVPLLPCRRRGDAVCASQDLALVSSDSPCLAEHQCDCTSSYWDSFCSSLFEQQHVRRAILPMGLSRSSSFTAACGLIFITRSITKPNCEPPPRRPTKVPRLPVPP